MISKEDVQELREIFREFDRELFYQNTASCCNGISVSQCHTLLEVEKKHNISISELANHLSLDKSTVSRTVDGLVNIDLLERIIPSHNRRKAQLSLTGSGKKVCKQINYTNDTYMSTITNNFSSEEADQLLRLLKKLTTNMTRARMEEDSEGNPGS